MIELRDLHKTYRSGVRSHTALNGIDLDVGAGEIFGVIGPSGAGKSTLVQCINLLETPDRGTIRIAGQALTGLSEAQLRPQRRRIGMVFQGFHLMSRRTVGDNVALPLEIAGIDKAERVRRVDRLLELVGLQTLADRYPAQISGGQKQRVGIARALANDPDVLLSDEATSALDPETTRSILALIRDINRRTGITVVMITHQMDVVQQICGRVAVLDHGRVVELGDTAQVFARPSHAVTRRMVASVTATDLDATTLDRLRETLPFSGALLWRWQVHGEDPGRLITSLVRDHRVDVELVQARIESVGGSVIGTAFVVGRGDAGSLRAAETWLAGQGVDCQAVLP